MRIVKTLTQLRRILDTARQKKQSIGFVPTMGSLHEGHLTLVRRAKKENNICVVSIFVNPTQFAPQEDYKKYPRDLRTDSTMLKKENVDILFFPSNNVIYPERYLTYIDVKKVSQTLCGRYRPEHFRGVATVVAKLLNMVGPDSMYLGQKDAQQVIVLKTMVKDLNFPVTIKVVETKREKDGLAMSSRNKYLTPQERTQAVVLRQALCQAQGMIKNGERRVETVKAKIRSMIQKQSLGKIQYIECVNAETLESLKYFQGHILIAVAVYFGKTRLIDNVYIPIHESKQIKG